MKTFKEYNELKENEQGEQGYGTPPGYGYYAQSDMGTRPASPGAIAEEIVSWVMGGIDEVGNHNMHVAKCELSGNGFIIWCKDGSHWRATLQKI